jgi:hypothetical protein
MTMRWLWPWRRSLIIWFTPVLLVVSLAMSQANTTYLNNYWLDITAKATIGMPLVCAGYAAMAAAEAGRWHRQYVQTAASRPALMLMALTLLPAAVGAVVIYLVNLVVLATSALPAAGRPNGWLLVLVGGLTVTYAAFGYALGVLLPRLFAIPLAVVGAWLWLVFPPSFQPFWVRNITGNLGTSCCSFEQVLPWRALVAPAIVGAAIALAAVLVISTHRIRWAAVAAAISLIGLSVLPARAMVLRYGADPVADRTDGLTCDTSTRFRICAWVEHTDRLAAAIPVLTDAATRLERAGLHPPTTLTENLAWNTTAWTFSLHGGAESDWRHSIALAPLTGIPPACLDPAGGGEWPAGVAYGPVSAWLVLSAGTPSQDLEGRFEPTDLATARRIRTAPLPAQATWARGALQALATCTLPAPAPPLP